MIFRKVVNFIREIPLKFFLKKNKPEILSQKYPLGPTSWRSFFEKIIPVVIFWNFFWWPPTCPKFNTHKKVVVHFFIPMLLLPKTPPLTYPSMKRFKGPKMDFTSQNYFRDHFWKNHPSSQILKKFSATPNLSQI